MQSKNKTVLNKKKLSKQPYTRPEVFEYGTVTKLTRGVVGGSVDVTMPMTCL